VSVRIGQERGSVLRAPIAVVAPRQTIFTLVLIDLHPSEATCAVDDLRIPTMMCSIGNEEVEKFYQP
jgi:hypothetical protein